MKAQDRILIFLMLLIGSISAANAADRFFVEPTLVEAGKNATLDFQLDNENTYYGFQTELILPSGLVLKSFTLDDARADSSYDLISNIEDGKILLAVFSNDHSPIICNSGPLLKMEVEVANDFTGGTLTISNTIFIGERNQDVSLPDCSAYIGLYVPVTDILLNKSIAELRVGEELFLTETVLPENATDKTVTWTSSNPEVAEVDDKGHVTALTLGETTITVSSGSISAICIVTVVPTYVTSITLDRYTLDLLVGDYYTLIATVLPEDATDKTVTWNSSDPNIATVDSDGKVKAIAEGEVNITATNFDVSATCKVTVTIPEPPIIPATGISLNKTSAELEVGQSITLLATVTPEDATDKTIIWSSSDPTIATVDANGIVTAIALGETTITATCGEVSAICNVTVIPTQVTEILLINTLTMRVNDTVELQPTVLPQNATDKSVRWSTSNIEVATVDQGGVVTSISAGTALITVTSISNPEVFAECIVIVEDETIIIPVDNISIDPSTLDLIEGDTYPLTAIITPVDATDKTVTWNSSDISIASVSNYGRVTAVSVGNATIYAYSSNGLTAECHVNVNPRPIDVISISLDKTFIDLMVEESETVTAILYPDNATDKTVTWSSSNEEIARVVNGVVTGVKPGEVTIIASSSNGKEAYCQVVVYDRPLTPKQLLRKGDGTTCTFVTLMPISDTELSELGYNFVYGYTETASGESEILDVTSLRYTHTTYEIFNNPNFDFWVFAVVENEDGKILNSNLRHLDGREEICFDSSIYGYPSNRGELSYVNSISSDEVRMSIYTMDGVMIQAVNGNKEISLREEIEKLGLVKGVYIVSINHGNSVETKKIVVR